MTDAELYNKAADIIESGWTKRTLARNIEGYAVHPNDRRATSWCLGGAIRLAVYTNEGLKEYSSTMDRLMRNLELREDIGRWNDCHGRRKKQVVALLRKAATRSSTPEGEGNESSC